MSDDKKHALLSPSSAYRWLVCQQSVRLTEDMPDEITEYATEGTEAHEIAEYKVKKRCGIKTDELNKDSFKFLNSEMDRATDDYSSYVYELFTELKQSKKEPIVYTEQHLEIRKYAPECEGTADCIIISDGLLHVIDFKYGKGVEVSAERNPQMMIYALGAYDAFSNLYEINSVKMSIFQPRLSNISEYEISVKELLSWAENELKPKAELAFNGDGEIQAGVHCRFCKAKAQCRARAEKNLELAKYEFRKAEFLQESDLKDILGRATEFRKWLEDVEEYSVSLLLKGGHIDSFKLVEGRSNRKYKDEDAVAKTVLSLGIDPYEKKLMGITAMTQILGKQRFDELLSSFIEKPHGKPTIVSEMDKRKAINVNDFVKEEENK